MRALLAIAFVTTVATAAHAAPWSVELPAGYTEQPGAAEAHLAKLRAIPGTVSVDAQVYTPADGSVQLMRLTWRSRLDGPPSRDALENMERGLLSGSRKDLANHVSDARRFDGDQLVADQVDEVDGARIHQKRIYAVDTSNIAHMLGVVCTGAADQLGACEKAQQTMQLTLPNPAALDMQVTTGTPKQDRSFVLGQITGGLLVAILAIWYLVRKRRRR